MGWNRVRTKIVAREGASGGKSEALEDAVLLSALGDLAKQIRRETSKFSSLLRARARNRRERREILENSRATSRRRRRASRGEKPLSERSLLKGRRVQKGQFSFNIGVKGWEKMTVGVFLAILTHLS